MTPKFRDHDRTVRDSKRKDRATTLERREVRRNKYDGSAVV
ncbi:hypothetical protein [Streptomyces sp. NRRL F-5123]|nr:hypothetical protein [Streptomyces sp. NRRL F-5123]